MGGHIGGSRIERTHRQALQLMVIVAPTAGSTGEFIDAGVAVKSGSAK